MLNRLPTDFKPYSRSRCINLPRGPIVVPFWGLPYRILLYEPQKGTTKGLMGKLTLTRLDLKVDLAGLAAGECSGA